IKGATCTTLGNVCHCTISGPVALSFSTPPSLGANKFSMHRSVRPFDRGEAADFSWLVKMSDVDGDLGKANVFGAVKKYIRADLDFSWQQAKTCSLDQAGEVGCESLRNCDYNIYPIRFQTSISGS